MELIDIYEFFKIKEFNDRKDPEKQVSDKQSEYFKENST